MAEQKTKKTTRKPKEDKVTVPDPWVTCDYKGKTYEVLEINDNAVKLTDGMIHFWVKRSEVL